MKTDRAATYPCADGAQNGSLSAERVALIDAILSDIGVPESLVPRYPEEGVRESACSAGQASPVCHVVAGANGSGKSTFSLCFLPRYAACLEFVNPDLIAPVYDEGRFARINKELGL